MNPVFQRLISQATTLTQGGNLQAATAAIQAALAGDGLAATAASASTAATTTAAAHRDLDVIDVQAREVRREAAGPMQPTPATQTSRADGQFIAGSHREGSATRDFKLYVPPAAASGALPLIVMLHGCTQNPDDFAAGTGMNEAALKQGFFVLYPAQAQSANPSRCWNWFKHNHQKRGRGEPALLAGMTRAVMKQHNIDPQRVYVAGLSAGGAMAAILGEAYPDLFAAVGVHSGLPAGAAVNLQEALSVMKTGGSAASPGGQTPPTIVFHGDQDSTVHPVNGERAVAASAGAAAAELERSRSRNGLEYTRRSYRKADGRVLAEHWAVHGSGHAWSGGSARGSYTDARGPDATQEMLRFFMNHRLSAAR